MMIAKILFVTWNIGWFWFDPQIGYMILPLTIIFMGVPKGTFK